jgi:pSer/pThr/pTyr-binding forkhead associated (FHA) protein
MIKCARCGNANGDDVLFCQFCGTRISQQPLPDRSAEAPAATSSGAVLTALSAAPTPSAVPLPRGGGEAGFRLVIVHRDGSDGITYTLIGDQIDIGRVEGDLLFDDPHLAPRHARISVSLSGRVLTPLEPRNGVYVRLRGPVDVIDGDHLLVGKQVLKFETIPEVERNMRPAVEHGVVVFGTPVRPPWARLRQITPAAVTRDVFHLTRTDLVLGREQGDIVFSEDEFMSRRHAQLSLRNGRARLEDLGSSNGTFVRLRGPHGLLPGDLIRLGDELLRFEIG